MVAGQAASVLGMIVGVRVMTELVDPATYGELALGITITTLANQVVFGPLTQGMMRFYAPAKEQGALASYWAASKQWLLGASCLTVLLGVVLGAVLYTAGDGRLGVLVASVFVLATILGCNSVLNGVQNAARQRIIVALHQGMLTWIRFLLAAGFVLILGATTINVILAYILAGLLVLSSQGHFLRKTHIAVSPLIHEPSVWHARLLQYSWPFAAWGTFYWAQSASDRWALQLFASTSEVGLYAVLFQMGSYPITIATNLAVQFLSPIVFQRSGDASDIVRNADVRRVTARLTTMALAVTGVAFLLTLLAHELLFGLFVASEYAAVSNLLPWVLLGGGLFAAGQVVSLNFLSLLRTKDLLPAKITTSLAGIACNFAGAYWFGVPGVVAAGVVFGLFHFLWLAAISSLRGASVTADQQ